MDEKKVCLCEPYDNYGGGPYVQSMLEYNPACPVHSYHVYDPRTGSWHLTQARHLMKLVDGQIEVCDTCVNVNGNPVAWDQTWHALHQDKARQVQHQWYQPDPLSEKLVPFCGDPDAKPLGFNTAEESKAVPLCRECAPRAIRHTRKEEWDKITSEPSINILSHNLENSTLPKVVDRVREALITLRKTIGR